MFEAMEIELDSFVKFFIVCRKMRYKACFSRFQNHMVLHQKLCRWQIKGSSWTVYCLDSHLKL